MLNRYLRFGLGLAVLLIVLTTSGCYTVLKMRTTTIPYQEAEAVGAYDDWHDPYFLSMYDPYHYYYTYLSWYASPWTYWCYEPYWIYPNDWWTGSSPWYTCPEGQAAVSWQKSQRRRGTQSPSSMPRSGLEPQTTIIYRSSGDESKHIKQLRKIGTGAESSPDRRAGLSPSTPDPSRTTTSSPPAVSRENSSRSASSSGKPATTTRSSTPARRRGSQP
jgi:hypothetical protein